jgi:phosphate transport system permease protein
MSKRKDSVASRTHSESRLAYLRWRLLKDSLARYAIGIGGISVIVFITLIFFYLGSVVLPLFEPANAKQVAHYPAPGGCKDTLHLALDEQTETGARFCGDGDVVFFRSTDGTVLSTAKAAPQGVAVTAFGLGDPSGGFLAYGLADGRVRVVRHAYRANFIDGKRSITPTLEMPFGDDPITVDADGQALTNVALRSGDDEGTLAATTADGRLLLTHIEKKVSFLDDEVTFEPHTFTLPRPAHPVDFLLVDKEQQHLFAIAKDGEVSHFSIRDKSEARLVELVRLVPAGTRLTTARLLAGNISILVGDSAGNITQWSLVRQEDNMQRLMVFRSFKDGNGAITSIAPEYGRKGFLAADGAGHVGIYHTTAHRTLLVERISDGAMTQVAVAPRADALLAQDTRNEVFFWRIHNEHPEVSWSSLWSKVWYENYQQPEYIWQSSAATDDFEPKLSLVPLTFGTLKAAFYAMLVAIPLALMGALYTAQFMSPSMRNLVKPSIEVMEALPTVILGFLAGLWLAPYVERNLPGVVTAMVVLPLGLFAAAYLWSRLPPRLRLGVPDGWEAALLIPVVIMLVWISTSISPGLETQFFGGDMRKWLTNDLGIGFDQRNAIIVGLAMGFAVVPNIFSIAEDAVFGVPKHLVHGSLALGATPWQTMVRVVLLTASPGIFSAIMIGIGRAVGETMIVLMATGNTAMMDFSPFLGLRTLSANIAVELPEAEVNSTHFRVLFLCGFVLFMFTFIVNTLAENIRHRLRKKYSSL